MMLTGRDIVIVGLQAWDLGIGSNCKNIAIELSKNNRVLYVNPPLDRVTYLKNRFDAKVKKRLEIINGTESALERINFSLWTLYPDVLVESINWITNYGLFNRLNKHNNAKLANCVQEYLELLGFQNIILFNDQSMIRHFFFKEMLQPELMIYYIRDNLSTIPYFKKHALNLEAALISKSDIVATNSEYLAEYARNFNSNAQFVGQGCDFELYKNPEKIKVPNELLHLQRPTIGYVGVLTTLRLNLDLLEKLALNNLHWHFVFVGPEDEYFKKSVLHQLNNVTFAGSKSQNELPNYIQAFDVCLNPQVVNEVTKGNYPRKLDEYLAMMKPVVATKTPFMEYFKEYVFLANDYESYVTCISKALIETSNEVKLSRRKFALSHSWENNVNNIYKLMNNNTSTSKYTI